MNSKQIILRAAMGYKPQKTTFSVYAQLCAKEGDNLNVIESTLLESKEVEGEENLSIGVVYLDRRQYEVAKKGVN